jgi:hypothetical protein
MAHSFTVPPASSFIVRFWCERRGGESRWRCQIHHMQSGESASCLDLESVVNFIQYQGVMADDLRQRGEKDV